MRQRCRIRPPDIPRYYGASLECHRVAQSGIRVASEKLSLFRFSSLLSHKFPLLDRPIGSPPPAATLPDFNQPPDFDKFQADQLD